ncbi:MAG: Peroxiredoxin [Myxococcaceae bacterium]|jgi:peroxiredoxin (alkyl hydroperoxide reductase subunit C)|nr:Peroxiredoxin [Myxococcaceae bacterium]MEA2752502.1 peroxiredoxin 2/4 [Myxococcales bacterium]
MNDPISAYVSLPRLNEPAPQFTAMATTGQIKLSDYKGKWVVLFSHPADFTPVCTTELAGFAAKQGEFDKRAVQLIGVSIDSVYSHLAWIQSIEKNFDVRITYPVIADLDTRVAQLYGMIHPGASTTATVRCVFVIDPNQTMRAMIYYPLTTGRSMDEVLRLVDALQLNAEKGLATPANWKPGDKAIVPAPLTADGVEKRLKEPGVEVKDWYLTYKQP